MPLDLAVVMPVYNEEGCIAETLHCWLQALSSLSIQFKIIVMNDGSNDGTQLILERFTSDKRCEVINKKNSGHGPTILQGYQIGTNLAQWVFQCDSDGEIKPDYFSHLWEKRDDYDALLAVRKRKQQPLARKIISAVSRLTVSSLFHSKVTDVNVPYRLMRSTILKELIDRIPPNTFAPNMIISGLLNKNYYKVYEYPVLHENRKTGKPSIRNWRLWCSSIKAFMQTVQLGLTSKKASHNFKQEQAQTLK